MAQVPVPQNSELRAFWVKNVNDLHQHSVSQMDGGIYVENLRGNNVT